MCVCKIRNCPTRNACEDLHVRSEDGKREAPKHLVSTADSRGYVFENLCSLLEGLSTAVLAGYRDDACVMCDEDVFQGTRQTTPCISVT